MILDDWIGGMRFTLWLVVGLLLGTSSFAAEEAGTGAVAESIAVETSAGSDLQIEERINGILSELDSSNQISAVVDGGVVTLVGAAPNSTQAQQALGVAERVAGVVAVRDEIDRTLKVQDNISPVVESLQDMSSRTLRALPLIGLALIISSLIIGLGWFISKRKLITRLAPNPFLAELISQIIIVISVIVALVVGLSLVGAAALLGTLLGGAGVLGIAIGFAVRDTMENYIASIMLSLRQPFRGGDHVVIDEREGIVIRLTTRATVLMTMDGNHLRIPNAQVFKGVILNYTTNPERRLEFILGVDAEDDPIAAIDLGLTRLDSLPFVLKSPISDALILEVGDSNILIEFHAWVDQNHTDFFKARSSCIAEVKQVLEAGGFSLPEPIYRVRLDATSTTKTLLNDHASKTSVSDQPAQVLEADVRTQNIPVDQAAAAKSRPTEQIDVSADTALKQKARSEQLNEENLLSTEAKTE